MTSPFSRSDLTPEVTSGIGTADPVGQTRDQHRLTVTGDSDLPVDAARVVTKTPENNLGATGRFADPDIGVVQAKYVRFGAIDSASGPAVFADKSMPEGLQITNTPAAASNTQVLGVVASDQPVAEGEYGWVIDTGLNPWDIDIDATSAKAGDLVRLKPDGTYSLEGGTPVARVVDPTKIAVEGGKLKAARGSILFQTDLLSAQGILQDRIGDIEENSKALTRQLTKLEAGKITRGDVDNLIDRLSFLLGEDIRRVERATYRLDESIRSITADEVSIERQQLLAAVANFERQSQTHATNAENAAGTVTYLATAVNQIVDTARVYQNEAGVYSESATEQANLALVARHESNEFALASATSAQEAQGFSGESETWAQASREDRLLAQAAREDSEAFAGAASTSEQNAAAHASDSEQSAQASQADRVLAQTARSGAEAAETRTAQSETNAAGSAATATEQKNLAVQASTESAGAALTQGRSPGAAISSWHYDRFNNFESNLPITPGSTFAIVNGVLRVTGGVHVHPKTPTPIDPTRRLEAVVVLNRVVDGSNVNGHSIYVTFWDKDKNLLGGNTAFVAANPAINVVDGVTTIRGFITPSTLAAYQNAAYGRVMYRSPVGGTTEVLQLYMIDAQESKRAEDSASASISAKDTAVAKASEATGAAATASSERSLAVQAKNDAVTQAGIATDKAGIATDKANIATTQAGIATSEAGVATARVAEATTIRDQTATYRDQARRARTDGNLIFNAEFDEGSEGWSLTNCIPITDVAPYNKVLRTQSVGARCTASGLTISIDPNRRYRFEAEVINHAVDQQNYLGFTCLDGQGNVLGNVYAPSKTGVLAHSTFHKASDLMGGGAATRPGSPPWFPVDTKFHPGTTQVIPLWYGNYNDAAGGYCDLLYFRLYDVTESNEVDTRLSSRISTEETTRANADSALASRATVLEARRDSGGNLVPDSELVDFSNWNFYHNPTGTVSVVRNAAGAPYMLGGVIDNYCYRKTAAASGLLADTVSQVFAVRPGSWIQLHALVANHRCVGAFGVAFYNAAGAHLGGASWDHSGVYRGGRDENAWERLGTKAMQVPAEAVSASVGFGLKDVTSDGYAWFCRPMCVEVFQGCDYWVPYTPGPSTIIDKSSRARLTVEEQATVDMKGAMAAFRVIAAATGSNPAMIELLAGYLGSRVGLVADVIALGNSVDGVIDEVLRIENGEARLNNALLRGASVAPTPTSEIFHPIQLKPIILLAADGDYVQYQAGDSYGAVPDRIVPNLTSLPSLPAGEQYVVAATGITSTGFTAKVKKRVAGTPTVQNATGPASNTGGNPQWQMAKPTSADAYDDNYRFQFDARLTRDWDSYEPELGEWFAGYSGTFQLWGKNSSGNWQLLGTATITTTQRGTGVTPSVYNVYNRQTTVSSSIDLGSGANHFGVHPTKGEVLGFDSVTYSTQTATTETTVTGLIPFEVYPPIA